MSGDVTFLFDRDPLTRTVQLFHWDDANERFWIEDRQDVSEIVEANKRDANEASRYRLPQLGDRHLGRRVANIPMNVLQHLRDRWNRLGFSWEERQADMKAFLNDPDNSAWRTDRSCV